MGISISHVQANYEQGDASLSFEILDSSNGSMLLAPFNMMARAGYVEKTSEGYTKATTIAGLPGVESWTTADKNGDVAVLVGGRYLLKVSGSTVPDVETIRKALEAVDLKKLAALR